MSKRSLSLGMVLLLALALPIMGLAQPRGYSGAHRGWKNKDTLRSPLIRLIWGNIGRRITLNAELNLTDEQRAEIRAIVQKYRKDLRPATQKIFDAKRALRKAILAEPLNEAAIQKASQDLGKAIGDASVLLSKLVAEVRPVLTPEQIETIRKFSRERDNAVDRWLEEMPK